MNGNLPMGADDVNGVVGPPRTGYLGNRASFDLSSPRAAQARPVRAWSLYGLVGHLDGRRGRRRRPADRGARTPTLQWPRHGTNGRHGDTAAARHQRAGRPDFRHRLGLHFGSPQHHLRRQQPPTAPPAGTHGPSHRLSDDRWHFHLFGNPNGGADGLTPGTTYRMCVLARRGTSSRPPSASRAPPAAAEASNAEPWRRKFADSGVGRLFGLGRPHAHPMVALLQSRRSGVIAIRIART